MLEQFLAHSYSPTIEVAAYEYLWQEKKTVKRVADLFREFQHARPSEILNKCFPSVTLTNVAKSLDELQCSITLYKDFSYPDRLRAAKHPVELLYYLGDPSLFDCRSVAVVGARDATESGIKRARNLARGLVNAGYVVMSGLAKGIDRAAHEGALRAGGRTIAVVGTPLNQVYPREHKDLHNQIAREHLVVSQWPLSYSPNFNEGRGRFPERNKTMSALSDATVIVEAGETSGSLTQARAALSQGRNLFIMNSCFERGLKWPERLEAKGAQRFTSLKDLLLRLQQPA